MDTPSIRSSGNKGFSKFRPIPIEQALLEKAKHFLESYQFDLRIRQHLHADKMEQSIGKYKYYILGNEQKYEPGYILVMKGHPVLFLQGRLQFGFALRLRLHASLYQNQAIFVGTLDTIQGSLRLEDVLLYEGKTMMQETYSKRYEQLRAFFTSAFVQDTKLSGLTVSIASLQPLSKLKSMIESNDYYSIDFVPDQANRRRLVLPLQQRQETKQKPLIAQTPAAVKNPIEQQVVPKEQRTTAFAFKIKGLPDTYELKDEAGSPLGKAAVQTTELSQLLRQVILNEGKQVKIQWYEEFERFKILGLVEE
jgi:hypothetical protein